MEGSRSRREGKEGGRRACVCERARGRARRRACRPLAPQKQTKQKGHRPPAARAFTWSGSPPPPPSSSSPLYSYTEAAMPPSRVNWTAASVKAVILLFSSRVAASPLARIASMSSSVMAALLRVWGWKEEGLVFWGVWGSDGGAAASAACREDDEQPRALLQQAG